LNIFKFIDKILENVKNEGIKMKKRYNFLRETLRGTKEQIVLILILTIFASKLNVYKSMFVQYTLDGVVLNDESVIPIWIRYFFYNDSLISKIIILAIILICLNAVRYTFKYLRSKINTDFNLKINRNVKQIILNHVSKLEYLEFASIDNADVIQRVNNDAITYSEFFNSQMDLFLDTIFIVGFSIIQIFELNKACGIFVFIICMSIILLSIWYYKASLSLVEDTVDANRKIISQTKDAIENSKMQKAFNRKNTEIENFKNVNEDYRKKEIKLGKYRQVYGIGTHTIRNFKEPIILLFGGILVVRGEMTLAVMSVLITLTTKISDYIYDSVDRLKDINQFLVAYKKLSNLMSVKEEDRSKQYKQLDGNILFKNVTVKAKNNIILENVNLEIRQNENIAIIGDNGTGKTVLAKTLLGFYEYDGDIFIGDTNIKDVSRKSVRDYIGLALQDTYLFQGTIRDNVNITNKELLDCEVEEALKVADIYYDVEKMENKLDTLLESGGENLSGGQKQRIAIARNIASDNEFIILDDSLSKLDTKTKLNILENIIAINKGMIIISHDIHVVKACERVIFINNKKLEINTHEYFMKNSHEYRQIIEMRQNNILEEEEE